MDNKRQKAKRLLIFYFEQVMRRSGVGFDGDNRSELEELADCLIDAAVEEVKAELQGRFDKMDAALRAMSWGSGP